MLKLPQLGYGSWAHVFSHNPVPGLSRVILVKIVSGFLKKEMLCVDADRVNLVKTICHLKK